MSLTRQNRVMALDLKHNLTRPLFWMLVLFLGLTAWGMSTGHMRIASGDSMVGGTKAWLTSEFAVAQMVTLITFLFYTFFIAVAAGMAVIQDDEARVGAVIHATPLLPGEYIRGKFLAVMLSFVAVLLLHTAFMMFFNHVVPNAVADEIRGPFSVMNYLRPALLLCVPLIFFLTATAFLVGVWTRKPVLVFVLPVVLVLGGAFFLWDWSPTWLDPKINRLLMILDPAGFRWLNETWLKVDRGVEFYNKAPMGFDLTFVLNRSWLILAGVLSLVAANRVFAGQMQGEKASRKKAGKGAAPVAEPAAGGHTGSIADMGMTSSSPGFLASAWTVARAETRELLSQPGLYLFVPIILLQVIANTFFRTGAFETQLLATPGTIAVESFTTLTLLLCLLLLFYTVESMEREKRSGFGSIFLSTPLRTGAALLGKALANSLLAVGILAAALLGGLVVILIQGKVAFDLMPFLIVWGLLLIPTFLVWTTFVMAVQALLNNRYTTYGVALGALIFTGYRQMTGKMNWVGNWDLWGTLQWSDFGVFEMSLPALLLNRIMVLGLTVFFIVLTMRLFPRAERDTSRTGARLAPGALLRSGLRLLPYAAVPVIAGVLLWVQVNDGFQGKAMEKKTKDYWRRNLATWRDAKYPDLVDVSLDLELEPAKRWFRTDGVYTLVNRQEKALHQVPLTGGPHWKNLVWTVNGDSAKPDDRVGLFVFDMKPPLAPGDTVRIGFRFDGKVPDGITKNGGGNEEFILPSGVVLTSFSGSFTPLVGYQESVGIDKDNKYDAKVFPDDFYEGITKPAFGSGNNVTTRVRITGPADYRYNSVGVMVSDEVKSGRRTTEWRTDHPVNFFNVVAGKWTEKRGNGTVIYHHPEHDYNVDSMLVALDASRKYYSEWFHEYPWKELKLSEFPALASYAQGFPTDITFSESIGFLVRQDRKADLAFMVTAHEAAHQWWGNILLPGEGPGGNILSEGMAHFSTLLLFEQVKGLEGRIEFAKRIEERYGDRRQVDSERPLVKIDGSKAGDTTVTYDKGGWVMWMLLNRMGRDNALAGLQEFIRTYTSGPDFPVLQDLVNTLRPFAPDSLAYEDFVRQWYFDVVMPQYRLTEGTRSETAMAGASRSGSGPDSAGASDGSGTAIADGGSSASSGAVSGSKQSWQVTVTVENIGTGTMPVEVAAVSGTRFRKAKEAKKVKVGGGSSDKKERPGAGSAADAAAGITVPAAMASESGEYRESRSTVRLEAGEKKTITLVCDFKPEKVIMDPDALVLQLKRNQAVFEF